MRIRRQRNTKEIIRLIDWRAAVSVRRQVRSLHFPSAAMTMTCLLFSQNYPHRTLIDCWNNSADISGGFRWSDHSIEHRRRVSRCASIKVLSIRILDIRLERFIEVVVKSVILRSSARLRWVSLKSVNSRWNQLCRRRADVVTYMTAAFHRVH